MDVAAIYLSVVPGTPGQPSCQLALSTMLRIIRQTVGAATGFATSRRETGEVLPSPCRKEARLPQPSSRASQHLPRWTPRHPVSVVRKTLSFRVASLELMRGSVYPGYRTSQLMLLAEARTQGGRHQHDWSRNSLQIRPSRWRRRRHSGKLPNEFSKHTQFGSG